VKDAAPPRGFLQGAERIGRAAETLCLVVVLGAMIMLAAAQILMRNLGLWGGGFGWADEALRIMVLWAAMLGAVAASREQRHICVDVLSHYARPRMRHWLSALTDVFTAVLSYALAWFSWAFVVESYQSGERILGDLPAWALQAILPVAFTLIGYRYTIWFFRRPGLAARGVGSP
jgi:TRAP-type C4-dicarboxylate transport system permease small subunit